MNVLLKTKNFYPEKLFCYYWSNFAKSYVKLILEV